MPSPFKNTRSYVVLAAAYIRPKTNPSPKSNHISPNPNPNPKIADCEQAT